MAFLFLPFVTIHLGALSTQSGGWEWQFARVRSDFGGRRIGLTDAMESYILWSSTVIVPLLRWPMRSKLMPFALAVAFLTICAPIFAHHGAAAYDMSKPVVLKE